MVCSSTDLLKSTIIAFDQKRSSFTRRHFYLGMDGNTEMLRGNVTYDDGDDEGSSWVSVCPNGLWKVQQKRSRGIQSMVSISVLSWPQLSFYER